MTTGAVHGKIIKAYKAAHPDVDWDSHVVMLARDTAYSGWKAVGHREMDERDLAFLSPDYSRD